MPRFAALALLMALYGAPVAHAADQTAPSPTPAPAPAKPASGENLLVEQPKGWQPIHRDKQTTVLTTRFAPIGQTPQNWTQLLTVQVLYGVKDQTPVALLERIRQAGEAGCEAVGAGTVGQNPINGYPAAMRVLGCTRNRESGQGEITMALALQGRDSAYLIQLGWRGEPFKASDPLPLPRETMKEWLTIVDHVWLCDTRDPKKPCNR
ncbi:MAG: hypothetical protein HQL40_08450 [Alphaproteobacteria bacterium]|nr:hypothetical protein [Alphaproteobacteria bacterium]